MFLNKLIKISIKFVNKTEIIRYKSEIINLKNIFFKIKIKLFWFLNFIYIFLFKISNKSS